jgi:hypothetical protein
MSQINVNPAHDHVDTVDGGDRTAAAGINLITVVIVLAVLAVIVWYLFTGPLRAMSASGGQTNINVNPAPTINVVPPNQPNAPAPAGNTGNGTTGTSNTGTSSSGSGTGNSAQPQNP